MTLSLSLRKLIQFWIDQGLKTTKIFSILKGQASRATIYRWVDRIHKNNIFTFVSPGRPRCVRTKSLIAKVNHHFIQLKNNSIKKIAQKEGCSERTIRRIINFDLNKINKIKLQKE